VMLAIPPTPTLAFGEIQTQDEQFSATICTNLLRPGRLRKCSTCQRVCFRSSQPPEHQDLGPSHSPEPLILGQRNRGCSSDRLVGHGLQRRRHSHRDL
jgi:hypothetical protein